MSALLDKKPAWFSVQKNNRVFQAEFLLNKIHQQDGIHQSFTFKPFSVCVMLIATATAIC